MKRFFKVLLVSLTMVCCGSENHSQFVIDPPKPGGGNSSGNQGGEQGGNQGGQEQQTDTPTLVNNDAMKRTMEMGLGWNLGNQLDAYEEDPDDKDYLMPSETVWGNPKVTQVALEKVRAAGFTTIRIPVTWLGKIGPAPDYKIDQAWMARVTEVVGYARNAGFNNIIVDTHHDEDHDDNHWQDLKNASKDPALNEQIKKEIVAVWTQIANNFKNVGKELMFEGFNELNDGEWGESASFKADPTVQCNVLNEWLQTFVDAVRATGGNNSTRWLGVSTYCANPKYAKYLVLPQDKAGKLMVSVHYYDPSDYTLGKEGSDGKDYLPYSDWGHTGASGKKYKKYDEDYVRETFGMLYNTYIANNIPVYIGEIGCSRRAKSDKRSWDFSLYYLEYVAKAARTYGLPAVLWDCGGKGVPGPEHHYYFRHDTGEYYPDAKEAIDVLIKGWFSDDPNYTLESVYNSAPVYF